MKRFLPNPGLGRKICLFALTLASATIPNSFAAHSDDSSDGSVRLTSLNSGAQIECITPDGRVERLAPNETGPSSATVLHDETLSCPLQEGITTFVMKLPNTSLLDHFTFVNENAAAAGELKISVSNYQLPAKSAKWVDVDGNIVFSHKRLFNLSMVGVEARYVKLSFKVASGGHLTSLNLYGNKALQQVVNSDLNQQFGLVSKVPKAQKTNRLLDYNFAALQAKGRVVYVSSGQSSIAPRMIDRNEKSFYPFAGQDPRPTAIVEFTTTEPIRFVRALYKSRGPGRFDVYQLEDMSKGTTDLKYRHPIASATVEDSDDVASFDFDPNGSHYFAVSFTPTGPTSDERPFELIELTPYGDLPFAMIDVTQAPDVYADQPGVTFPGEGHPDISSRLGVIAVPPVLPPVSQ
jgi:hypothetical protein